jgi:hypothetical protein
MLYERTQRGYVLISLIVAAIAFEIWITAGAPAAVWINVPVVAILVITGVIFSSMTIRVSADRIDWCLGFRMFPNVVYLADITECTPRTLPLIAGLGLRTNDFRNWLVVVGGRSAVVMRLRSGRTLMLGSPEADRVCAIVNQARSVP